MRKAFLIIGFVLFACNISLLAQAPFPYRKQMPIDVWEDNADTTTIGYLLKNKAIQFKPIESVNLKRITTYWFRLDFEHEKQFLEGSDSVHLNTGYIDKAVIFFGNPALQAIEIDYKAPNRTKFHHTQTGRTFSVPIHELVEGRYIFIRINFFRGIPNPNAIFRYNSNSAEWVNQNFISLNSIKLQFPLFILIGIVLFLVISNIGLFAFTQQRQYFFYLLFLIFQIPYFSRSSALVQFFLFGGNELATYIVTEFSQVAANLCYLLFARHFLDTQKTLPFLDKFIVWMAILLATFIALDMALLLYNPLAPIQLHLMNGQRYFMGLVALLGMGYLGVKGQGSLRYFILLGTLAYAGGAFATMFLWKINYMIVGSTIENIIFSIGIAYKIRNITESKHKSEQEAQQIRISALRAQMNPHFIFNSLNSIQYFIHKSDRANALAYLTKFSTLMRQILESSIKTSITLKEEIELLRIYLDLESLRFNNAFTYSITVDDSLELENLEVPLLLLQPYIENAINHGLLPKESGPKEVHLIFSNLGDRFKCTIRDTGIGRKAALERKKLHHREARPSRGMDLSRQRLNLMAASENHDAIVITDLPEGTCVEITILKT